MKINSILLIFTLLLLAGVIKAQSEIEKEIAILDKVISDVHTTANNSPIKSNDEIKTKTRKMTINADLHVIGGVTCNKITAEAADISGNINIAQSLKANDIVTNKLTTETLVTEKIVSPTGVLTLAGDLVINSDVLADGITMRGSSFQLEGVKQWGLVEHDDFETEKSFEGWSDKRASRCKEGGKGFVNH
jgi:hypothetical protein